MSLWGSSPRNRRAKYLLRRWLYFDTNMEVLNEIELRNMRILYAGLKVLNDDEVKLLAEKYRVDRSHPITDKVLAKDKDIPIKEFKEMRIDIENRLQDEIDRYRKEKGYDRVYDINRNVIS